MDVPAHASPSQGVPANDDDFLDPGHAVRRCLIVLDVFEGTIVDADSRVLEVGGWPVEELIGVDWTDLVHSADHEAVRKVALQTLSRGTCRWACRLRHADGSYVMYFCEACLSSDGRSAYFSIMNAQDLATRRLESWQYERLSELAKDLFVVTDRYGTVLAVNQATEHAHGMTREEIIGCHLTDFVTEEGVEILATLPDRFEANGGQPVEFTIPARDGDGNVIIFECVTSFDEETQRWYTVERDATERFERDKELEIGQRFFEISASQLVLLDRSRTVLRTNAAFCSFLGVTAEDAEGRDICELLKLEDTSHLASAIQRVIEDSAAVASSCAVQTKGGVRTLAVGLTPGKDGETLFFSSRDVTEEQRLADELLDRASHDRLTGLANREVFNEALDVTLQSGHTAGVLMLDLDEFKRVNDSLGHAAGDELLCLVAARLRQAIRPDDLVARFGGDEFVVLLRGVRSSDDAGLVAENILGALAEPYMVAGRPMDITVSIGVTVGSLPDNGSSQLLRQADAAAYKAKRSGRNQMQLYDEQLELLIQTQLAVELNLRSALRNQMMDVDVQGIYSVDGELLGVEALARMVGADQQRFGPSEFLDVARRLGLLAQLGEAVVDRALSALAPWLATNPQYSVSLNADPIEVAAPAFVSMLEKAMDRYGVDPMQVILEITESGLPEPDTRAAKAVTELRKMGMRVSIGDFGTGASSLGYLRDMRVDQVKIDRSFVEELTTNRVSHAIAKTVVSLANELGIQVVAEGVAEQHHLDALVELGCPVVQGYLLHSPQPVEQFLQSR